MTKMVKRKALRKQGTIGGEKVEVKMEPHLPTKETEKIEVIFPSIPFFVRNLSSYFPYYKCIIPSSP